MLHRLPVMVTAALLLACAGCGDFRGEVIEPEAAERDGEVVSMQVLKVWDMVGDNITHHRGLGISHYIEVRVLSGPKAGSERSLPYSDWMAGKAPPKAGTTVTAAPCDWVKRSKDSKGRPFGGW